MSEGSINWRGRWNVETSYYPGDGVFFEEKGYVVASSSDPVPWNITPADATFWTLTDVVEPVPVHPPIDVQTINWRGPWACETTYVYNDGVDFEGGRWVAIWPKEPGVPWNIVPTTPDYWQAVEAPVEAPVEASIKVPLTVTLTTADAEILCKNLIRIEVRSGDVVLFSA